MCLERFKIDNRVAVITGAAGLLGVQHSNAILEAGGKVVLLDINEEQLNTVSRQLKSVYAEDMITAIATDISSEKSIEKSLEIARKEYGSIDILINNAALNPKVAADAGISNSSRLEYFSIDDWNQQMTVGLTGAFLCAKVFGTAMANSGRGGVIVNISSDLSVIAPDQRLYSTPGLSENEQPVKPVTYSVIKSGLIGLTRYLATYWVSKGVRCNALSPGGVYVDQPEQFVDRIVSLIPMGRMAEVDEYTSAIQFLCSDASSYMNGHNLVIDGGRTIL